MAAKTFNRSLTAEQIRAALDYNPYTGLFRWRYRHNMSNAWNGKHTGQPAGSNGSECVKILINHRMYKAHRLAWVWMTGEWPTGLVDHIDGNPTNNIWGNLREATHIQNTANAARLWRHNTSGFRGVHWNTKRQVWTARIFHKGTVSYLGRFATPSEAHEAYVKAATAIHGEYARQSTTLPNLPKKPAA